MLHLAGVLGRSSKIRSFGARFAPGAARARRYREIYRPTPPNPRKIGRAFHPAAGARNEPRVTAAARTATRHACGSSISHALRWRPARQCATAAACTTMRYGGGNPHKNGVAAKATAPPKRCATSACGRGSLYPRRSHRADCRVRRRRHERTQRGSRGPLP